MEHHSQAFALRRLAALLDVPDEGLKQVAKALRLSNDQAAQLSRMANPGVDVSVDMKEADVRKLVYLLGNDTARSLLLLAAAKSVDRRNPEILYRVATTFRPPRFPLLGDDLLRMGYASGPEVGRVLHLIEKWWIGKDFAPGRAECLQMLNDEFKRGARGS